MTSYPSSKTYSTEIEKTQNIIVSIEEMMWGGVAWHGFPTITRIISMFFIQVFIQILQKTSCHPSSPKWYLFLWLLTSFCQIEVWWSESAVSSYYVTVSFMTCHVMSRVTCCMTDDRCLCKCHNGFVGK